MQYLKSYKVFEEENKEENIDLSDELKEIGRDLKSQGKKAQDAMLKIAESDPELKQKLDQLRAEKQGKKEGSVEEEQKNESLFTFDVDEVNEGVALGLALSSGAILQLVGKFLGFIGKKLDKKDMLRLQKAGEAIEHYGHSVHHGIINLINTILKPLIFWMSKEKQHKFSNVVFMAVLALKISSGSIDPTDYKTAAQMAEAALNTIKAGEITAFLAETGKNLVSLAKAV